MKKNIVLIGMTGCGKSTIGRKLSKECALDFIDMDEYIEENSGQSIPQLFAVSEEYFRDLETKASKEIAAQAKNTVISCGGGVVLRKENIDALKKTGWIIFIDRPVENIANHIQTAHRPLLKEGTEKLYQLAKERIDLYHQSADIIVKNDSSLEKVIEKIQDFLQKNT